MKKIILVGGSSDPLVSYEYHNFLKPLEKLGWDAILFDFMAQLRELGRYEMNSKLLAAVKNERPDVVFFVPYADQFIPKIVDEISRHTITLGYLFDDT